MTINNQNRYLLHISYLGTNYSGWQIQNNANTIQGLIMDGMQLILDKNISLIVGAGRTDAGVHAVNFFAHFDYTTIDVNEFRYKLNRFLPDDIVIHSIRNVSDDYHARFSALSRTYEYWISTVKDPFLINRSYFYFHALDLNLMNESAQMLVGTHDFGAFSKSKAENSTCSVKSAVWVQSKNMLIFSIKADRFLHNMVRCIVGTLVKVGLHTISLDDFSQVLFDGSRSKLAYSVPASGLYLMNVKYPKSFNCESI